jgi:hypothetical protein
MKTLGSTAALLFVLAAAVGCASSEVTERQSYIGDEKLSRPNRIIVYDFAATPADVPADSALAGQSVGHSTPQTPEEIETGRELGAQVAKELVGEIQAMGLPAVRAAGQPAPRIGDLVIRGYFVSIREGSAGKRLLVGFGSGANELRTVVEGYQMTSHGLRPLGMRETEAGGGEMPGMLVPVAVLAATGSPVGLIVGGAAKLKGETGSETIEGAAKRTAKEIGQELQIAFERQGWIRVAAAKPEPASPAPAPQPAPTQAVQSAALGTSQTAAAPIISDREAFALQLASFKNAEAAEQEWSAIQGRFPKLLDEASAVVQPANVEGIGKVYRLKAGTFPNRATAADVCAQLKAARQDCLVVQR